MKLFCNLPSIVLYIGRPWPTCLGRILLVTLEPFCSETGLSRIVQVLIVHLILWWIGRGGGGLISSAFNVHWRRKDVLEVEWHVYYTCHYGTFKFLKKKDFEGRPTDVWYTCQENWKIHAGENAVLFGRSMDVKKKRVFTLPFAP